MLTTKIIVMTANAYADLERAVNEVATDSQRFQNELAPLKRLAEASFWPTGWDEDDFKTRPTKPAQNASAADEPWDNAFPDEPMSPSLAILYHRRQQRFHSDEMAKASAQRAYHERWFVRHSTRLTELSDRFPRERRAMEVRLGEKAE